jgi:hypothetical protein
MIRKNSLIRAVVLILGIGAAAAPLAAQQGISVKQDIRVEARAVQENVVAFGGNVVIEGRVKDSVVVFGGTVRISGEVGDSVVGIGSRITLEPSAVVGKDLICLGGSLDKQMGAGVRGDTVFLRPAEIGTKIFRRGPFRALFGLPMFPLLLLFYLIGALIWLIAGVVIAVLFPKPLARAAGQVRAAFWPVFGTGLLSIGIFLAAVLTSILLCLVLIGIPVLFALIWLGAAIKLFGQVVMLFFFGESLLKAFRSGHPSAVAKVVVGIVPVTLFSAIPFIGWLFAVVAAITGWGAVVRTKFGTTDNWFGRKPQTQTPAASV